MGRVTAYVRSRVGAAGIEDVVADTYLTAWRPFGEIPARALPWLLVTARKTAAQANRANGRRDVLVAEVERLHHLSGQGDGDVAEQSGERLTVLAALAGLSPGDRQVLMLTAWDGMTARGAARLLGCSSAAAAVRSLRARRRLAAAINSLEADPTARPGPVLTNQPSTRLLSEPVAAGGPPRSCP